LKGAHVIVYSADAEADRAFFRDVLELRDIDIGGGWLLFALPPTELAVHPAATPGGKHELYFICDDIEAFRQEMMRPSVPVSEVSEEGWGALVSWTLPGGSDIGVYQSHHPQAHEVSPSP